MSDIVNLYDAKTHPSQRVDRAAKGEEIVIAKNGRPLVRLTPAPRSARHGLMLERVFSREGHRP